VKNTSDELPILKYALLTMVKGWKVEGSCCTGM